MTDRTPDPDHPGEIAELRRKLAAAEAAAKASAESLAEVSHEIRTPMGAIISMADLLLDTRLDETQKTYAETLRRSATGLVSILSDILDNSKLEAGRLELNMAAFSPRDLMQDLKTTYAAACSESGLYLVVQADPAIPEQVRGDVARIRRVLSNIIDNAIKFTEEGSVIVTLSDGGEHDGKTVLEFCVRDTGIGMSAEAVGKLYSSYTQADPTISERFGGTGLGLSIARKLVRKMGGEIECESSPGRGTTFRVSIPLAPATDETARRSVDAPRPDVTRTKQDTGRIRILVVEDNRINQMLITTYLGKFGYDYDVAPNGEEALRAIDRTGYDLILMDIQMPGMDGMEATRRIRKLDGPAARLPIIALTANAMQGDRECYLAAGMDDYISKPIIAATLYGKIDAALAESAARDTGTG